MLAMAFFGCQPNQKYEEFSTDIGLLHSHYRRGIMLTTLRALQKDALGLFTKEPVRTPYAVGGHYSGDPSEKGSIAQSVNVALCGAKSPIQQPAILQPGYITVEHCD